VGGIVNQFVGKITNEIIGKATGAIKDVFSGLGGQVPAEQLLAAQNAQEGFRAAEYGIANRFSPDYTTAEDAFGAATLEEATAINFAIDTNFDLPTIDWDIV